MGALEKITVATILTWAAIGIAFTISCGSRPSVTELHPKKTMIVEVEPTSNPDFLKVTVDSCHQYLAQRYTSVNGGAGGLTHLEGCEYCKQLINKK